MAEWFYTSNRQQLGPVSLPELKELASARILRPQDLVWKDGMADWVKASTLPELFSSSGATATGGSTTTGGATANNTSKKTEPDRSRSPAKKDDDGDDWGKSSKTLDGEDADLDNFRPGKRAKRHEYDEEDDDRRPRSRSKRDDRRDDRRDDDDDRPSRRRSRPRRRR